MYSLDRANMEDIRVGSRLCLISNEFEWTRFM
jgi:hypothetical protein